MKPNSTLLALIVAAFFSAASVFAAETGKSVVLTQSALKWKSMGNSGVATALVAGDMDKGPCRFFLKYPAGLVTPAHHHSSDHHGTVISGAVTLTVAGKEHLLGPGDYFMLADRAEHTAKVEGKQDVIFLIEAEGPWDVVMAK